MAVSPDPLNLIICGVGGQGNILVSNLIGTALVKKGYFVTRGETFGAAQRSGAVMSSIRVSPTQSCGPLIPRGRAHVVLGLEPLETVRVLQKYGNPDVACVTSTHPVFPMGAIISEDNRYPGPDSLRETIRGLSKRAWFVDAAAIAEELGTPIAANIVMMGALLGAALLPLDAHDLEAEIRDSFPPQAADLNLEALRRGIDALAAR